MTGIPPRRLRTRQTAAVGDTEVGDERARRRRHGGPSGSRFCTAPNRTARAGAARRNAW